MKLCKSCGAHNADERAFCIDCGKRLGKPLTAEKEAALEAELDQMLERAYQNSDELRATRAEKIFAAVLAIAFVAAVAGCFLAPEDMRVYFLLSAILVPPTILTIFGGKLLWRWERWKLSFRYELDPEQISVPTLHLVGRKLSIWLLGILALAILAFALMQVYLPEAPPTGYLIVDGQIIPLS